jgi:pilus assembly protein CpaE
MGEPAIKLVQRVAAECPRTAVICASRESSPDMILRSMRAGARDFLRLPIIDEELTTVIERTAEFAVEHAEDDPKKRGKVLAVFSSKGGCGTSLIATNLALMQKTSTVLVDLNLQSGDLELLLGVKPILLGRREAIVSGSTMRCSPTDAALEESLVTSSPDQGRKRRGH